MSKTSFIKKLENEFDIKNVSSTSLLESSGAFHVIDESIWNINNTNKTFEYFCKKYKENALLVKPAKKNPDSEYTEYVAIEKETEVYSKVDLEKLGTKKDIESFAVRAEIILFLIVLVIIAKTNPKLKVGLTRYKHDNGMDVVVLEEENGVLKPVLGLDAKAGKNAKLKYLTGKHNIDRLKSVSSKKGIMHLTVLFKKKTVALWDTYNKNSVVKPGSVSLDEFLIRMMAYVSHNHHDKELSVTQDLRLLSNLLKGSDI